jgi:hypothetical protein
MCILDANSQREPIAIRGIGNVFHRTLALLKA